MKRAIAYRSPFPPTRPHTGPLPGPPSRRLGRLGRQMARAVVACAAALLLATPVSGPLQGQEVTLEGLMAAPFPSEIVASPVGDRVAWVLNVEGSRNIWVAEGPAFEVRQLTAYQGDDGKEVGGLQFTPDGEHVLYVYGGQPNRAGEAPNPVSFVDPPARGAFWLIPFAGGESRLVAEGGSPALSPDGSVLAFVRQGAIWTVALRTAPRRSDGPIPGVARVPSVGPRRETGWPSPRPGEITGSSGS